MQASPPVSAKLTGGHASIGFESEAVSSLFLMILLAK